MSRSERSPITVIKEAELLSGSNDFVRTFYELKASTPNQISLHDIDEDTERNLLAKADDFVFLTLAQYCLFEETLSAIFSRAIQSENEALRLACLTNQSVARVEWSGGSFPSVLFRRNEERLVEWVGTATREDLWALFENKTISTDFVCDILSVEGKIWNTLTEQKQSLVLSALSKNPRARTDYDGPLRFNGDYSYRTFHSAIWDLAKTLPVTRRWAAILSMVLEDTIDDRRGDFDSLEVAKRWIEEGGDGSNEEPKKTLNDFENLRRLIYADTFEPSYKNEESSNEAHLAHPDVAYRASAYENLRNFTVDGIKEAHRKDGDIAVDHLLNNLHIWREEELREALESVCWKADRDRMDEPYSRRRFWSTEDRVMEKNPSWFAEGEGAPFVDDDDKVLSFTTVRELFEDSKTSMRADTVELLSEIKAQLNETRWKLYGALGFVLTLVFFLR
jgi:hypothetical protein